MNSVALGLRAAPGTDAASFDNLSITASTPGSVPALSDAGFAILTALLAAGAVFALRRQSLRVRY